MKGIEFDKDLERPKGVPAKNSWAIEFVIKTSGYRITDPSQAGAILLVIFIFLMSISLYNFYSFSKKDTQNPAQVQYQKQLMNDKLKSLQSNDQ